MGDREAWGHLARHTGGYMPEDESLRTILERIEQKLEAMVQAPGATRAWLLHPAQRIAEALGVSLRTLYRWRHDPDNPLVCVHLGSGLATTPSMVDGWLAKRYEIEQRRVRRRPRTRQDVRSDPLKRKIMARVQRGDEEAETQQD